MAKAGIFAVFGLAALALGQAVQAAPAEQKPHWVESSTVRDGEGIDYVDPNSITRAGDIAQIAIRTEFLEGKSTLRSGEGLLEVNCKTNQARMLKMLLVDTDGKVIEINRPGEWREIPKDSPADNAAQFACRETPAAVPAAPRA